MLGRPLHFLSILLTLTVVVGFGLFAIDEMDGASQQTTVRIAGDDAASGTVSAERQLAEERLAGTDARQATGAPVEAHREARNGAVREAIDDANDFLLAPFDGFVDTSDDVWVRHGVPATLGLLLYGFLLSYGARAVNTRS